MRSFLRSVFAPCLIAACSLKWQLSSCLTLPDRQLVGDGERHRNVLARESGVRAAVMGSRVVTVTVVRRSPGLKRGSSQMISNNRCISHRGSHCSSIKDNHISVNISNNSATDKVATTSSANNNSSSGSSEATASNSNN